jgi:hypothetical protein
MTRGTLGYKTDRLFDEELAILASRSRLHTLYSPFKYFDLLATPVNFIYDATGTPQFQYIRQLRLSSSNRTESTFAPTD